MFLSDLALSMLLALPNPAAAPPAPDLVAPRDEAGLTLEANLQEILDQHRARDGYPGAVIALHRPGAADLVLTSGVQSLAPTAEPVDASVPWNIGSCTKSFVAVTVLQLVEEGRLELDQPIGGWLPQLAGIESITVRQLLQHTSGLAEYLDLESVLSDAQRPWSAEELIREALARDPLAQPGERHAYSNTNYLVLGCLVEAITGQPWNVVIRARILDPLGMAATGYIKGEGAPTIGAGHGLRDGQLVDFTGRWDASLGGAAGGMYSTATDLLRFAVALGSDELLAPSSRVLMRSFVPAEDQEGLRQDYGLGLQRYSAEDVSLVGHIGSGAAHSAIFGTGGRGEVSVAVLVNREHPGSAGALAIEVLRATEQGTPALPKLELPALDPGLTSLAPEAGFHGSVQLMLGGGRLKPGANQAFGGSSQISSLDESGLTKNRMVGGLNLDLNYTVPEHETQYFVATSEISAVDAAPALEIGVRRQFANGTVLTGAYAPELAGAFNEVWEDPFAIGVQRAEVEMDVQGYRLGVDQPFGLPLTLEYQRSQQDLDREGSGAALGLTTAQRNLLRRSADVQRIGIGSSIPLAEALVLMPHLEFTTADADGAANSFDGFTGGLQLLQVSHGYEFSMGAEIGNADYEESHPVFDKQRSDDRLALSAGIGREQPFGWQNTRIDWLIALDKTDSNIAFFESEQVVVGVALTYSF